MGVEQVLRIVLTLVLIGLAGFGIYGVWELVRTLRSVRVLADGTSAKLPGLLEDTDIAVQAVSLELMRIDDVLENVQRVSDNVEEAVHAPVVKVAEYAERARRFIGAMRER